MVGRVLVGIVAVALGAATASCGSADGGVSQEAVRWADRVCQSVNDGAQTLASPPRLNPADPTQARDGMVGYLDLVVHALDAVSQRIDDAGPPPVTDGRNAVVAAKGTIGETRSAIVSAQERLRAVQVTDLAHFQQEVGEIGKSMASLGNVEGPIKDLKGNHELNLAFSQAKSCQALETPA